MFVEDGKFRSVAAFLDGYDWTLWQVYGKERDDTDLGGFRIWLADRCWNSSRLPRNMNWSFYIRKLYPEDREAFERLPLLFDEYLTWRSSHEPRELQEQWQ
jgi:hypothetical protein